MDLGLKDKLVLVTGSASGIGKATALKLGREGATVVALSRTRDEIEATAAEIERAGGKSLMLSKQESL